MAAVADVGETNVFTCLCLSLHVQKQGTAARETEMHGYSLWYLL